MVTGVVLTFWPGQSNIAIQRAVIIFRVLTKSSTIEKTPGHHLDYCIYPRRPRRVKLRSTRWNWSLKNKVIAHYLIHIPCNLGCLSLLIATLNCRCHSAGMIELLPMCGVHWDSLALRGMSKPLGKSSWKLIGSPFVSLYQGTMYKCIAYFAQNWPEK